MTWVIGASSIFGYGAIMSDIRVTFADGNQRDMLQKAYALGPYIIGGFAGSVKIGFELLDFLRGGLVPPPGAEPGAWDPVIAAEHFKSEATSIFANADRAEQDCGSHILLVGISNEVDPIAARTPNAVHGPRAFLIKMMSPTFEPIITKKRLSMDHIGSGASVDRYTEVMQSYFDLTSGTLQAETAAFGMWPKMLADGMRQAVVGTPIEGISPHVHILVCRFGEMIVGNNDIRIFRGGSDPIDFKMPKVATSYAEFVSMCEAGGLAAQSAVAGAELRAQ